MRLKADLQEARSFLSLLAEDGNVTWQYYSDRKSQDGGAAGHFSENIERALPKLEKQNNHGLGIFWMVNEGDCLGRSEKNVKRVRSLFVDLDGAPLEPVLEARLEPHVVVESSPGRYQVYWLVDDCPLERFSVMQMALARKFESDPSVKDLPRVMRVPGFWHQKKEPFRVRILQSCERQPYLMEDFLGRLTLEDLVVEAERKIKEPLPTISRMRHKRLLAGERHETIFRYACKLAYDYGLPSFERKILIEYIARECCEPRLDDSAWLERANRDAQEYAEEKERVFAEIQIEKKEDSEDDNRTFLQTPDKFFNPPGLVGETFRWILSTNIKPQPELSLAAALVACGTVMGRKVRTETNLRTNLYILALVETGAGKEASRAAIQTLFGKVGKPERARVEDISSDSAILEALEQSPAQAMLLDEFGRMMRTTQNAGKNPFLYQIPTLLMRLYTSANRDFSGKHYASSKNNRTIKQPCLSMLATSTPSSFFGSISREAVTDGLLGRCLLAVSGDDDPEVRKVTDPEIPALLLREFVEWERVPYRQGGDLDFVETGDTMTPVPRVVCATEHANNVFALFEAGWRRRRKDLKNEDLHGLFVRASAIAQQVALILACGCNREYPKVEVEHAQWACEYVNHSAENMLRAVKGFVYSNQNEAVSKRIERIIKQGGKEGVSMNEIHVLTRDIEPGLKKKMIGILVEAQKIEEKVLRTRGRPAKKYLWIN